MVNQNEISNFFISKGDSVHIPTKPDFNRFVNIQGKIKNPGKYPFNPKMKLSELIEATMSMDDEDFSKSVNLEGNLTILSFTIFSFLIIIFLYINIVK